MNVKRPPSRSSRACVPSSTRSRAPACSCRRRKTSGSVAGRRGHSSSSRCRMPTLPELRDVATDQQTQGTTLELKINRDTAARYGIQPQVIDDTLYDAFGQRQVTQYFTQLNSYHVILEILPELQGNLDTLNKIYIKSPTTGDQVPLSTFASWTSVPVRSLSISHQGQFPAITISFNLAQGVALGQATDAVQKAMT